MFSSIITRRERQGTNDHEGSEQLFMMVLAVSTATPAPVYDSSM
jgi:hypothetical protein